MGRKAHLDTLGYENCQWGSLLAEADGLTIEPGLKPITLAPQKLEQLGLHVRDDFKVLLGYESEKATSSITP